MTELKQKIIDFIGFQPTELNEETLRILYLEKCLNREFISILLGISERKIKNILSLFNLKKTKEQIKTTKRNTNLILFDEEFSIRFRNLKNELKTDESLRRKLLDYIGWEPKVLDRETLKKLYVDHSLSISSIKEIFQIYSEVQIRKLINKFKFEKPKNHDAESRRITNELVYGVSHPNKLEENKRKEKEKCLEKYGVDHVAQLPENRQKSRDIWAKKTKKELNEIKEKRENTCLEKYGTKAATQRNITNFENLNEKFVRANFIRDGYFYVSDCAKYFNVTGMVFSHHYREKWNIVEPTKNNWNKSQEEIYDWIKQEYPDLEIFQNVRKIIGQKELDIYIPELNLAIEYNGIMFHSFGDSKHSKFNNLNEEDSNHLLRKTLACQEKGIRLIHIWESEWKNDREGIKSFLKSVIEETEEFLEDTIIFDRRFAPIEIPGYLAKYGNPHKYYYDDKYNNHRVYYDCGIAIFEKSK